MPGDLYDNFLWVYPAFLLFQSIIKTKAMRMIMSTKVSSNEHNVEVQEESGEDHNNGNNNNNNNSDDSDGDNGDSDDGDSDNGDEDPKQVLSDQLPLDLLCPACFGSDFPPEFVVLCFDACMQQRCLDRTIFNQSDEFSDGRHFINPAKYKLPDDDDGDEVSLQSKHSIDD
jgi:hypothetical protein